jgi:integrase
LRASGGAFLGWARGHGDNFTLWHVLALTGARRGEALALRWRDFDLEAATVRIRRSVGMVRNAGESAEVLEGDTKSGKPHHRPGRGHGGRAAGCGRVL